MWLHRRKRNINNCEREVPRHRHHVGLNSLSNISVDSSHLQRHETLLSFLISRCTFSLLQKPISIFSRNQHFSIPGWITACTHTSWAFSSTLSEYCWISLTGMVISDLSCNLQVFHSSQPFRCYIHVKCDLGSHFTFKYSGAFRISKQATLNPPVQSRSQLLLLLLLLQAIDSPWQQFQQHKNIMSMPVDTSFPATGNFSCSLTLDFITVLVLLTICVASRFPQNFVRFLFASPSHSLSSWTLDFPSSKTVATTWKFNTVFTKSLKSSATKFRPHLHQMDILNPKLFLVPACKVKAYNYSGSLNTTSRSFKFVDSDIRGCLADFSCTCRGQKKKPWQVRCTWTQTLRKFAASPTKHRRSFCCVPLWW